MYMQPRWTHAQIALLREHLRTFETLVSSPGISRLFETVEHHATHSHSAHNALHSELFNCFAPELHNWI